MKRLNLVLMLIIFTTSGCASLLELSDEVTVAGKAGKDGIAMDYPVDTNQAWDITKAVFRWQKTDEIEEHRDENYIITSTGMKMVAFGSVLGVWIKPVDSEHTMITVVTKRRVKWDVFSRLTANTFFERFEQGVNILKSGKILPVVPP